MNKLSCHLKNAFFAPVMNYQSFTFQMEMKFVSSTKKAGVNLSGLIAGKMEVVEKVAKVNWIIGWSSGGLRWSMQPLIHFFLNFVFIFDLFLNIRRNAAPERLVQEGLVLTFEADYNRRCSSSEN